jgi:uncharacterized membrane-anchored protein YjiN (DUF445 family)
MVTGTPANPFQPRADEAERQTQLDRMKRTATGMLAVAGVILVVARVFEPRYPWLGYVRATAEASVVGGLADWFAVTAIFRHPLGIPIPHTAIIGRQKDRIGRIMGNFVQQYFLSRESVAAKLRDMRIAERVMQWLADPGNASRIAGQVAGGLARALEALPDEDMRRLIQQGAADRIRAVKVAPVLGKTLSLVVAGDRHQELLNQALTLTAKAVTENRDLIRQKVKAASPWWVPKPVDERIYQRIVLAIEGLLREITADPAHPVRERFDRAIRDFVEQLQHSPEAGARAEALKAEWLSEETLAELSSWVWESTRRAVAGYASRPEDAEPGPIARGVSAFGSSMLANPARLAELEEFIVTVVAEALERHRHEAADMIARTVERWDPEATSRRMELAVGRDLQFVRINGTLVGGLVGLLLYAVPRLFGK